MSQLDRCCAPDCFLSLILTHLHTFPCADYEEEGAGKRQRGGSRSGASSGHPSGGAWQPPAGQQGGPALAGAQPEVVATDGTKMRIKINRGPGGKGGGDDATPRSGVGQGMGSSDAGGEGKAEQSKPRQQAAASGTAGQRVGGRGGRSPEPVALLSKKLLRVGGGLVGGLLLRYNACTPFAMACAWAHKRSAQPAPPASHCRICHPA